MNRDYNINNYFDKEDSLDFRELLNKIKKNWYWLAICGFIGASVGYLATKMITREYEIGSTLLVTQGKNQLNAEFLFEGMGYGQNKNTQDQIGILSSYMINRETVEQLDWRASWFQKDIFGAKDIYQQSPFEVVKIEGDTNLLGVKVNITPYNDDQFVVKVDDKLRRGSVEYKLQFESRGSYGVPFKNKYFSFIIHRNSSFGLTKDDQYFFVFNDYVSLTNDYREKVEISLSDEKSNLIHVKLRSTSPERAVHYLNELSRVYIQFGLNEKNQASENTVQFIDTQLSGIVDSLNQAGQDFTNFRTQNRVVDLSQEAGLIMERLREVESSQTMAKMKLDYYKNLVQYLGDAKKMEQMVAPSVVGITDQSLNAMVLSLGELYSKKNALALTVQERNPSLVALENEITYTQQGLQENLKNLISNAEVEIRNLEQSTNKINAQLSRLPKTEQNLVNIKRSFDLNNDLYTFLLQKRAEAAIAKASTTPDVKALDIARIENAKPVGSNKMIKLGSGLLGGLLLPILLIFISDYFDNKINRKEEIEKVTSIPIIGTIYHNKLKTEFPVLRNPNSAVTESFRSLRTNLQYLLPKTNCNIIAVQSMAAGEGKSFVSLNLAIAYAINNKKVLLVDGDLRKPQLHDVFNKQNTVGLSTFLLGKASFEEIIFESKIKNLYYVTTGPIFRNTAELVDSKEFKNFINFARNNFEVVIINNSPISIVTDGVIVGANADSNLIVTRQGFSYKEHLKTINEFAKLGQLKMISLVFNDIKSDTNGYYVGANENGYGYFDNHDFRKKPKWRFKPSKEKIT